MGQVLAHPITSKLVHREGNQYYTVASAEMQGYRETMEDRLIVNLDLGGKHAGTSLFAVFDGHSGDHAAEYLRVNLTESISALKDPFDKAQLHRAIMKLDASFLKKKDVRKCGSTCVCALVKPQDKDAEGRVVSYSVLVANVGDSRAVITDPFGHSILLTRDHKPDDPEECKRVRQAGGTVSGNRVDGELAMSRAIGDYPYKANKKLKPEKQKVTAVPEFTSLIAHPGDALLLCCDGIFERLTTDQVGNFVYDQLLQQARVASAAPTPTTTTTTTTTPPAPLFDAAMVLNALIDHSLAHGSRDNMSGVLVHFSDGQAGDKGPEFYPGSFHHASHDSKFVAAYLAFSRKCGVPLPSLDGGDDGGGSGLDDAPALPLKRYNSGGGGVGPNGTRSPIIRAAPTPPPPMVGPSSRASSSSRSQAPPAASAAAAAAAAAAATTGSPTTSAAAAAAVGLSELTLTEAAAAHNVARDLSDLTILGRSRQASSEDDDDDDEGGGGGKGRRATESLASAFERLKTSSTLGPAAPAPAPSTILSVAATPAPAAPTPAPAAAAPPAAAGSEASSPRKLHPLERTPPATRVAGMSPLLAAVTEEKDKDAAAAAAAAAPAAGKEDQKKTSSPARRPVDPPPALMVPVGAQKLTSRDIHRVSYVGGVEKDKSDSSRCAIL